MLMKQKKFPKQKLIIFLLTMHKKLFLKIFLKIAGWEGGGRDDGKSMIVGGGGASSTGVGSAYPLLLQWPRYIPATVFT